MAVQFILITAKNFLDGIGLAFRHQDFFVIRQGAGLLGGFLEKGVGRCGVLHRTVWG